MSTANVEKAAQGYLADIALKPKPRKRASGLRRNANTLAADSTPRPLPGPPPPEALVMPCGRDRSCGRGAPAVGPLGPASSSVVSLTQELEV